jgi:hypothetical protein
MAGRDGSMTLGDVVQDLVSHMGESGGTGGGVPADEAAIYAAVPWTADSEAQVAFESEEGGAPEACEERGLTYFL